MFDSGNGLAYAAKANGPPRCLTTLKALTKQPLEQVVMAVEDSTRSLRALQDIPIWQIYPETIGIALERARKWGPPITCVPRESCDKQCPEYVAHMEALHPTGAPSQQRPRRRRRYKYACSREWLRSLQGIGPGLLALVEVEDAQEAVKKTAFEAEEAVKKAALKAEKMLKRAVSKAEEAVKKAALRAEETVKKTASQAEAAVKDAVLKVEEAENKAASEG